MALQRNNMSPMGFGQPQRPQAGWGMPGPAQPRTQPPMPGAGHAPEGLRGVPPVYQKKPTQSPADAAYTRIQHAILNPSAQQPPQVPPPPPPMPPMMGGMPPGPMMPPPGPPMMGPPGPPPGMMGPPPQGPQGPPPSMADMMAFMNQHLGAR
jgi:hypothetical protein